MELAVKTKNRIRRWFLLCPVRHGLTLAGGLLLGLYYALSGQNAALRWIYSHFTAPVHRGLSRLCSFVPFSVAEVLIYGAVLGVLIYLVAAVVQTVRRKTVLAGLYRLLVTAAMLFVLVYGGFCYLWGVYYAASDFERDSGIRRAPLSVEQLETVTSYFAQQANFYGAQVDRDEGGLFDVPLDEMIGKSATLYDAVAADYPCLAGQDLRVKPFHFSRLMSYIKFTGFFFPYTAEANINIESPACLIPSTIAHELAHQRGVAEEDVANFVAVLASFYDGDPEYCYSASLLAYIHLGNALHKADKDAWSAVYGSLSEEVRADLSANNAYWAQFETPVSNVTDTVYTGFLKSYGQEQGLKTYGACIDLLVAYYYDIAKGE